MAWPIPLAYFPLNLTMQAGFVGQPVPMHPMAYPGQPQQQQFVVQPGFQAGQIPAQPGPPAHVMGHPNQFLTGQPGQFMQAPGAPQGGFQYPAPQQPGGFQQVGGGVVNVANLPPEIMGMGRTRAEFAAEQAHAAMHNEVNEPQDFQPADPNPGRMYWCRQLDNEWTQVSRATIDGTPCRWYVWPSGVFYAVRLEE
ncbi:hypothetical protein SLS62_006449 [Diatrype stigma]|uniref:Uncharacterized protein n=1 Tax=Diatrype stigma TaxID=117547 RepID=A0AAN9YMT5_9PEZI